MNRKSEPRIGVAAIICRGTKVLLGLRRTAHGHDTWGFPGGHLENGEEIIDCASREILEETGLTVANLRLGPYTNDIFSETDQHYVTIFVLADYVKGDPELREPEKCSCWKWHDWKNLPNPLFLPIVNLLKQGFGIPG